MELKTIDWKVEDGIGHLILNTPPANIMTGDFFNELEFITSSVMPKLSLKALMIYGKGRHFSAGADHANLRERIIKFRNENPGNEIPEFMIGNLKSFLYISNLRIPTIAVVRGTCLGSALELALTCRYRICAEGAVLGLPETSFGLMPGCGGTIRLAKIAGYVNAIDLILSGRNFSAGEALKWGIVHKVVVRKSIFEESLRITRLLINQSI